MYYKKKIFFYFLGVFVFIAATVLIVTVLSIHSIPCIVAHRGYTGNYCENTIPSFIDARLHLYNAVELDVRETKDGVLVLAHNNEITDTKGSTIKISENNFSDLKEVILQDGWHKIRIARLDEALKVLSHLNMEVAIHCKVHTYDFCKKVAQTVVSSKIKEKRMYNIDVINDNSLNAVLQIDPKARFHIPYSYYSKNKNRFKEFSKNQIIITIHINSAEKVDIKDLLIHNNRVYLWGVNTKNFVKAKSLKPTYIEMIDSVNLIKIKIKIIFNKLIQSIPFYQIKILYN